MTHLGILVPQHLVADVTRTLTRLGKRAGVKWSRIPGETTLLVRDPNQPPDDFDFATRPVRRVAITCARFECGSLPRGEGWEFVARLQHTEAGTVVSCAPDETVGLEWRDARAACRHCGTTRYRSETFLLRPPADAAPFARELVQIGRNCLADFMSIDAAAMVARAEYCDLLTDFYPTDPDSEGSWSCGGPWVPATSSVLAHACCQTRVEGFSKGGGSRNRVEFALGRPPEGRLREDWEALQPTAADVAEAHEVALWAATDDKFAASDYGHNVRISLACLGTDGKRMGIVVSAPAAYHRAMGVEAQRRITAAAPDGGHWGEVGKRATVQAQLTRVSYTEGAYGSIAICGFRTESNQDLVWFASGAAPKPEDIGTAYAVKATPKRHETRNGRAQTIVSRAVLSRDLALTGARARAK
jgi:hypothetical protein